MVERKRVSFVEFNQLPLPNCRSGAIRKRSKSGKRTTVPNDPSRGRQEKKHCETIIGVIEQVGMDCVQFCCQMELDVDAHIWSKLPDMRKENEEAS